jgi:hypothetical protein
MRIGVIRKGLTFSFGTLQKPWDLLKVPPRYRGQMAFLLPAHAGLRMCVTATMATVMSRRADFPASSHVERIQAIGFVLKRAGGRILEVIPGLEAQEETAGGTVGGPVVRGRNIAVVNGYSKLPLVGGLIVLPQAES